MAPPIDDLLRNFPSGPQAALLRVITSPGSAADGWAKWQQFYQLRDVEIYRLIPALYARLAREGVEGGSYLRGVVRHCYAARAVHQKIAEEVAYRFAQEDIRALALKGWAMTLHLGYAPRHMSDVDLLVPHPRINDAIDILTSLGWVPDYGVSPERVKRAPLDAHAWGFNRRGFHCDLHWHSVHQDQNLSFDEPIWASAEWKDPVFVPSRSHLLFQLVLHGIRQHARSLVWTADLFSLMPATIEWDAVFRLALDRRLLVQAHVLREAIRSFGVDVPELPKAEATVWELHEHRGLTTRNPSNQEKVAMQQLALYRRNSSGTLKPYNERSLSRIHRRPTSI